MTGAKRRAVWVLGACQCAFWGVLYYGFSVLLAPMEREFAAGRASVAGAFTVGLLAMALAAPAVGRWIDHDRAPHVFRAGALLALSGMTLHATARSLVAVYFAWIVLGAAMAALLYEPAFGLVTRAFDDAASRLRALAAVTVAGGLASTLFLPLLALAVERLAWRRAWALASLAILAGALAMERFVFPHLPPAPGLRRPVDAPPARSSRRALPGIATLFASSTFSGMAFSTLLIPLLVERGHSATLAAATLGLLGSMQVPGRIWMLRGGRADGRGLVLAPLALQAAGLAAVAAGSPFLLVAAGAAAFGLGAGLHTLARPWLVQELAGVEAAGSWNGRVARIQGFARASGPLAVALVAGARDAASVFAGLAVVLALLLPLALGLERAAR